jgi:hypothetical protein
MQSPKPRRWEGRRTQERAKTSRRLVRRRGRAP